MKAEPRKAPLRLRGRRITRVDWRRFSAGPGHNHKITTDPVIYLDDGSYLTFSVAETDGGEYGIDVSRWQPT